MPTIRRPRRAFSLVEILVVVAIIAVLIALLVPALQRAKEQAITTVCLSNLKQVGIDLQFYSNQYNSTLTQGLAGYDASANPITYLAYFADGTNGNAINNPKLYCPKNSGGNYGIYWNPIFAGLPASCPDFAINPTGYPRFYGLRLSRILTPSNYVLAMDTATPIGNTFQLPDNPAGYPYFITYQIGYGALTYGAWLPHINNRANVSFADGHGESSTPANLKTTNNYNLWVFYNYTGVTAYWDIKGATHF